MEILTNITKFSLYSGSTEYPITNVEKISYQDSNRYVKIGIPYSKVYQRQMISPQEIKITAICLDPDSLQTAIEGVGGRDATITKVVITAKDSDMVERTYTFNNVYIEEYGLGELTEALGTGKFVIKLSCDTDDNVLPSDPRPVFGTKFLYKLNGYYYVQNIYGDVVIGGQYNKGNVLGTSLSAVIDAALLLGGKTEIQLGTQYLLDAPIHPVTGSALVGAHKTGVVVTGFPTSTAYSMIDGRAGVDNFELGNFTLNVNNKNESAAQLPNVGLGVVIVGNRNWVHDLVVYNSYLQGIVMGLNGYSQSTRNLVERCEVYNAGNDGIILGNSKRSHILNCYVHDNYGPLAGGYNICYGSRDCSIRGSHADNTVYGFGTDHALPNVLTEETNIQFINCEADNSWDYGFQFDGGRYNKAIGCVARNFGQKGFCTYPNPRSANPYYDGQVSIPTDIEFANCLAIGDGTVHTSNTPTGFLFGGGSGKIIGGEASKCVLGAWITSIHGITEVSHVRFSNNWEHHIMGTNNTRALSVSHLIGDNTPTSGHYFDPTTQDVSGFYFDGHSIIWET